MSFLGNFVSGQNYKIWNFGMFLWRLSYANVSVSHCICWIYLLPHPLLETISIRFRTLLNHCIVLFILRVNSQKIQIFVTQNFRQQFLPKIINFVWSSIFEIFWLFNLFIPCDESSFMIHQTCLDMSCSKSGTFKDKFVVITICEFLFPRKKWHNILKWHILRQKVWF